MKKFTFYWRYLALFVMLFGALSMYAQTPIPTVTANVVGDNVEVTWDLGIIFLTQNPGVADNGYWQDYGNGYGVVYDLSSYPDALAHSIEFHHTSWGVFGPFDYNIRHY